MKLLRYLIYCILVLYTIKTEVAYRTPDEFIPLILRTRELYGPSVVVFAHPEDIYGGHGDLRTTHMVHTWIRTLGRENVLTWSVQFKSMYKVKNYFRKTVRPLIVVTIPNLQTLFEFSNATKTFDMSFPQWLVIFLQTLRNKEHNYCYEPVGNLFNLAFNAEMLVLCQDDNVLREWYSVDTNTTEIFELATYDPLQGIVLHTDLSLYDRRNDLKGTILRGIVMKNSIVFRGKNGKFEGFFAEVFNELIQTLNFTLEIVSELNEHGSFNSTTNTWSGTFAQLTTGQADIGLASFSMMSDRLDIVDYLVPLLVSRNCIYIKEQKFLDVQWSVYFQAFSPAIWLCMITIMITFPLILLLIKNYSGTVNKVHTISEEFLQIWGIFCQQGLAEFPESSWLRVTYFTLLATAIVTSAAYSASLICFLTARIPFLPFLSINEFVEDGSYDLVVVRGSAEYDSFANAHDPVSVAMMKLMRPYDTLPENVLHAYEDICKNSKLAFYSTDELQKWLRPLIPCEISVMHNGRTVTLSFILSKGSPYTACFNHHLQKFRSTGLLDRLKVTSFPKNYDRGVTFQAVEIFNVITVLTIFGGGMLMSIAIVIVEALYYNYTHREECNNSLNTQEWPGFEFLE